MTLVVGSAVVIIVIQVYSREIKKAQENMGLFSKMTQNNGITTEKYHQRNEIILITITIIIRSSHLELIHRKVISKKFTKFKGTLMQI